MSNLAKDFLLLSKDHENLPIQKILYVIKNKGVSILLLGLFGALTGAGLVTVLPKYWYGTAALLMVEEGEQKSSQSRAEAILSAKTGLGNSKSRTRLKVLESSNTLLPVYKAYSTIYQESFNEIPPSFDSWKSGLEIYIPNQTDIVELYYKDKHKSLVLPTLSFLIKRFQDSVISENSVAVRFAIQDINKAIEISSEQVDAAYGQLEDFRLRHGIFTDAISAPSSSSTLSFQNDPRVVGGVGISPSQSLFASGNNDDGLKSELEGLNVKLIERRSVFKDNDPSIQDIKSRIASLQSYMEKSAMGRIGFINDSRSLSPSDAINVVKQYNVLVNRFNRNKDHLASLQKTLLVLKLDESKTAVPWKVINSPVLSPFRKGLPLRVGISGGFLIASLLSIGYFVYKRRSQTYIHSASDFADLTLFPQLETFESQDLSALRDFVGMLSKQLDSGYVRLVGVCSSSIKTSYFEHTPNEDACASILDSPLGIAKNSSILIVVSRRWISLRELVELNGQIKVSNLNLLGWVWIDD